MDMTYTLYSEYKEDLVVTNVQSPFGEALISVSAPTHSCALLFQLVSTGAMPLKRCALSLYIFHRLIFDAQPRKWRDSLDACLNRGLFETRRRK